MLVGIDELFEMLNCNNTEEMQRKGIEEGKKIKYFSMLFQPTEDKEVWENCAKIIASKSNEKIEERYLFKMLSWLQDEEWPGYEIIQNRLKLISGQRLKYVYSMSIREAIKLGNEKWLRNLAPFAKNKVLYEELEPNEREVILQYIN